MRRVRLIHGNEKEGEERAARFRGFGYDVDATPFTGPPELRAMRADPPDAVVIDLSRRPARGRDLGLALRQSPATRAVPLVFLEGEPEQVKRVRALLPDAVFATWRGAKGAVARAIAKPPKDPVRPGSVFAGYSGTPLPKKLMIKTGGTVALLDAPDGFESVLGALPDGVTLRTDLRARADVILLFVRSLADLDRGLTRVVPRRRAAKLWICWPKMASGIVTDVNGTEVRARGLAAGIVDYKIAAVDATWSGLAFA